MAQAVLFDLDGVLVRSEETWFRVLEEAGRRFRGRAITRDEFMPTFGQGTQADIEVFGLKCTSAQLDSFYVDQFREHANAMWINPEAAPLLCCLRAKGLRLAVVTNSVTILAEQVLAFAGLQDYFEIVAGADQVQHAKPAPDIVIHVCGLLGVVPTETWMIGDSRFDRCAASTAGATFVGLGIDGDLRVERLAEVASLQIKRGN